MQCPRPSANSRDVFLLAALFTLAVPATLRSQSQPKSPPDSTPCVAAAEATVFADLLDASSLATSADRRQYLASLLGDSTPLIAGCPVHANLVTQIAVLQFRSGDMASARQTITGALASGSLESTSPVNAAVSHFMLAGIHNLRSEYTQAEHEYKRAIVLLTPLGPSQAPAVSRIYGEMAAMFIQNGDLRSGESALQMSLELEESSPSVLPEVPLLRRDALVHLYYREGRITDALNALQDLVREYGDNASIPRNLRAHLYRDFGEVSLAAHQVEAALERLKLGLSLSDPSLPTPDYAINLLIMAKSYHLQNKMEQASQSLREAFQRSQHFQQSFPQEASLISISYGMLLNKEKQYGEARAVLTRALQLGDRDHDLALYAIRSLIESDRHLHDRQEESSLRSRLRSLLQSSGRDPAGDTVDVMAFAGNLSH